MKRIKYKLLILGILIFVCIMNENNYVYAYDTVKIAIDPGHGGTGENEQGAEYNGLKEKDVNLAIAKALKLELEQYGNVEVILTRTDDTFVSIEDRVKYAVSEGADYIVSVHNNASAEHLFFGSEIFVPSNGELYCKGYSLAHSIMNKWQASGCVSKGIKTRIGDNGDYYGIIRYAAESSIPAIILEHAYLDNDNDFDRIDSDYDWDKFGRLDAEGIADFFGIQENYVKENIIENIITNTSGTVRDDKSGPKDVELVIDSYNEMTGNVSFTLNAKENESKCMYYAISTSLMTNEDGKDIPDVKSATLWDGDDSVSGKIKIKKGYNGPLYAVVFNNYNVPSDVVSVELLGEDSDYELSDSEEDEDLDSITIDSSDKKRKNNDSDDEEEVDELEDIEEVVITEDDNQSSEEKTETINRVDPSLYSNLYGNNDGENKLEETTIDSREKTLNKMMFAFVVAMTALIAGCLIIAVFTRKKKD